MSSQSINTTENISNGMKILVIGSGGREHALVWKIAQSRRVDKIFCAPGNAGIAELAECIDIKADDLDGLLKFAKDNVIDLTVVGPEIPLCAGIVDLFTSNSFEVFGPDKTAAQLEGSKVFAKEIMAKFGIPTAGHRVFSDSDKAIEYIKTIKAYPVVIKAEGLAAGKGVIIVKTQDEAEAAAKYIMIDKVFGASGDRLIVEECLEGEEASILAICDGEDFVVLPTSQDHKRIFDDDQGPNTGGMGAYSPAPVVNEELFSQIEHKIIRPLLEGMKNEDMPYKGVLYVGIMITTDGPKVLEFNVRFGDPETQAVLPRIKDDLVDIMMDSIQGNLKDKKLDIDQRPCVDIVMASGGYPGKYEKGKEITGLGNIKSCDDIFVFHAGTLRLRSGQAENEFKYVTNGGRVLGVTALGNTIKEAIDKTYQAIDMIYFEKAHFRRDIGRRAVISG